MDDEGTIRFDPPVEVLSGEEIVLVREQEHEA